MMRKRTRQKGTIGSTFDEFLKEEGTYESTHAVAIKRVLAWQIAQTMATQHITTAEMARRMDTSRSQLNRLLDPTNLLRHVGDTDPRGPRRETSGQSGTGLG